MHKPNHVCKYSGCTLGEDGGRKHYYACNYCDRVESWKSVACCREHYTLYIREVLEQRALDEKGFVEPERTDMTEEEIQELKAKPIEEVKAEVEEELKEFADENGEVNIPEAVEIINERLDNSRRTNKKRKKE